MRGRSAMGAALVVLVVIATGCPHEWMKGGTIDRSMAKDMKESLKEFRPPQEKCPEGKSWKEICEETDEDEELVCRWDCL